MSLLARKTRNLTAALSLSNFEPLALFSTPNRLDNLLFPHPSCPTPFHLLSFHFPYTCPKNPPQSCSQKHIACSSCRQRKLKCDGNSPCEHCTRLQRDCVYSTVVLKSGPRKGFLKQIESRLDVLESKSVDMASFDPSQLSHDQVLALVKRLQEISPIQQPVYSSRTPPPVTPEEHFSDLVFEQMFETKPQNIDPTFVFVSPGTYRQLLKPGNAQYHLKYALALLATVTPQFAHLETETYSRALSHLAQVESQPHTPPDIPYLQALVAIWLYEHHKSKYRESWTTAGKATRTAVAMRLHLLDSDPSTLTDLSEPRRVFWAVFSIDRYQIIATSWPKVFAIEQVTTKFPVSTDSFLKEYSEPAFDFTTCIEDHEMFGMHHFIDDVYCFTLIWVIVCGRIFDMPDKLIMLQISARASKVYGSSNPSSNSHFDIWWACYQSFKHCFAVAEAKLADLDHQSPNVMYCRLLVKAVDTCLVRRAIKTCLANNRPVQELQQNKYKLACQSYQLLRQVNALNYSPRITSFIVFNIVQVLLSHLRHQQTLDPQVIDAINWCLRFRKDENSMFSFDFDVTQICDDFNQEMVNKGLSPPLLLTNHSVPASPVSNLSLSPQQEFYTYDVKTDMPFPILDVANIVPPLPFAEQEVFPLNPGNQERFYL